MKILITGASGSIGREIVEQLVSDNEIICFDRNEEKIFYLEHEIKEKYPLSILNVCLGSITDKIRIQQVFEKYSPDIVYHTAANKHVPLGEQNVHEFIYNNIEGTKNLVEVCKEHNTKLVFISTDKAVEPSSVMGYTKRLCEKYLLTTYDNLIICRFGNIIGSSGSVIQIFEEQAKKGNLTVTHPDMERYFINVEQAVKNLILCSKLNKGLYIFDMGKSIKIMDIAKEYAEKFNRRIDIIGLRPGEKIKERLIYDFEVLDKTKYSNIFKVSTPILKIDKDNIEELLLSLYFYDSNQLKQKLKTLNDE